MPYTLPNITQTVGRRHLRIFHKQSLSGYYTDFEINRGLSQERTLRFFQKDGERWTVKDEDKTMAAFRCMDLMDPFQELGILDLIFCRNVAVYFSREDRRLFFRRMADAMHCHGYLIVGSTESLGDLGSIFIGTQHYRHNT